MKTRQLVLDAMLAAICFLLANMAFSTGTVKVTFESVPVLIGALLFGPVDGLVIGGIGTLLYQMLSYGFTATTVLWIIPYMVCGLFVGLCAKIKGFELTKGQVMVIVVIGELMVTLFNTIALYVDSHLYGYYYPTIITGVLLLRLVICVVKAMAYSVILPALLKPIRKTLAR